MQRLRDLIASFQNQMHVPTERPTSLYEAGRVGSTRERPVRRETRPDARFESGAEPTVEPTAEERTTRRERAVARPAAGSRPRTSSLSARQIRSALKNPESVRSVILLREVLDVPVSRRPRRR